MSLGGQGGKRGWPACSGGPGEPALEPPHSQGAAKEFSLTYRKQDQGLSSQKAGSAAQDLNAFEIS